MAGYDPLFGFDVTQKQTLQKWLAEELAAAGTGGAVTIADVTGLQAALDNLQDQIDALPTP